MALLNRSMTQARAAYGRVDVTARAAAADPHQLITILFDELSLALSTMPHLLEHKAFAQFAHRQTRALNILHGLESSLDPDAAPALAETLRRCYEQVRRLVVAGARDRDMARIGEAATIVDQLAGAWAAIGR